MFLAIARETHGISHILSKLFDFPLSTIEHSGHDDERGEALQRSGDLLAVGELPVVIPEGKRSSLS